MCAENLGDLIEQQQLESTSTYDPWESCANLEDRVKAVLERVKVGPGRARDVVGVVHAGVLVYALLELGAEDLRAEEGEDAQEEEEQHQQREDGLDRVDERGQQVLQRLPVPEGRIGGRGRPTDVGGSGVSCLG